MSSGENVQIPNKEDVDLILNRVKQNMADISVQDAAPTDTVGPEPRIRYVKTGGVVYQYVLVNREWHLMASTQAVSDATSAVGQDAQNQFSLRGDVLLATGAFADAYFSRIYIPNDTRLDTLKCWYRIYGAIANGTMSARTVIDGSLTSSSVGTAGSTTPTWLSETLDISSLTKGADYTLTVQIMKTIGLAVTIDGYVCYLYEA